MQAHGKCAANSPEFPEHLSSHDLPMAQTQTDPKQTVVVLEEEAGVAAVRVSIVTVRDMIPGSLYHFWCFLEVRGHPVKPAICADLYGDSGRVLVTVKSPKNKKSSKPYHVSCIP